MSSSRTTARCSAAARLIVIGGAVLVGGCSSELPPRTTLQLMRDPTVLQGVLLRCYQLQNAALRDAECRNAREAVERLAAEEGEQDEAAAVQEEFEKARDARRARDENERRRQEAAQEKKKVDPYTMPLVPAQPTDPVPAASVKSAAPSPDG